LAFEKAGTLHHAGRKVAVGGSFSIFSFHLSKDATEESTKLMPAPHVALLKIQPHGIVLVFIVYLLIA
jgi:hypothetical protein